MVKEVDLKSTVLCTHRFKSCHCRNLSIAQLVEQRTVVPLVTGSNPVAENSASVRVVKELPLGGNVEKRASSNLVLHNLPPDSMAEWLRRLPAKQLGSAPAEHEMHGLNIVNEFFYFFCKNSFIFRYI